jgi:sterol desaturase/sphingolipid hydroxylase (fatty acid hydroxylase superfamily)
MSGWLQPWYDLIAWVGTHAVAPTLALLHLQKLSASPGQIAEATLLACLQLAIIGLLFRPLESLAPAEPWKDRKLVRVDFQYTVLMLLGLFPLFSYLVLTPIADYFGGGASNANGGDSPIGITHWIPVLNQHPLLLFAIYYLIYDLVYYWMHRIQHAIPWWWALHSMHHSQRQLSCWANDRSNYLDGVIQSLILAVVGLVIGVAPDEFALLMLLGELVQNFSHTNVRFGFGSILEKLFIDPRFHRLHHMIMDPTRPRLHYCNFGQVFAFWDVLFGTALYGEPVRPTGVGDPMVDADNGRGVITQQWGAIRRFWGAFTCLSGWVPGDVVFGPDYRPIPTARIESHPTAMESLQD